MTKNDENIRDANELLAMCLGLVDREIIQAGKIEPNCYELNGLAKAQQMIYHAQVHLLKQTSLYAGIQRSIDHHAEVVAFGG